MPKFFCDYCDVYLTHDSMSVRKAHNSGRNHLRNVVEYYQRMYSPMRIRAKTSHRYRDRTRESAISHRLDHFFIRRRRPVCPRHDATAWQRLSSSSSRRLPWSVKLPKYCEYRLIHLGMPPPPFGMQSGANGPMVPPLGGKGMPFPPPFPPNGQPPPNLPAGMPFPPPGGFPPNLQFPPQGRPGGFGPPPGHQGPPNGLGFPQQGPGQNQQGPLPGFGLGAPSGSNDNRR